MRMLTEDGSNRYFMATGFGWAPEQVVDNETFEGLPHKNFFLPEVPAEFAEVADFCARRKVELALEVVRSLQRPEAPSRQSALYLSRSLPETRHWVVPGSARAAYEIYELTPLRTDAIAALNYDWFNYLVRLARNPSAEHKCYLSDSPSLEFEAALRAYWSGRTSEHFGRQTRVEVLLNGALRVVRKIPRIDEEQSEHTMS